MSIHWYILDKDHNPIPSEDHAIIGRFFASPDRIVKQEYVKDSDGSNRYWVSTVFLILDHNFFPNDAPPLLFETMIFDEKHKGVNDVDWQERTTTWALALEMHERGVEYARKLVADEETEAAKEFDSSYFTDEDKGDE